MMDFLSQEHIGKMVIQTLSTALARQTLSASYSVSEKKFMQI
jgi:hypothetical protein